MSQKRTNKNDNGVQRPALTGATNGEENVNVHTHCDEKILIRKHKWKHLCGWTMAVEAHDVAGRIIE